MSLDFMLEIFRANADSEALVFRSNSFSYQDILDRIQAWEGRIKESGIKAGSIVGLHSDYSPDGIALFLALIKSNAIIALLTNRPSEELEQLLTTAEAEFLVNTNNSENYIISKRETSASHSIYQSLRSEKQPGLVLFSSGISGESKAAVHNMEKLLEKYRKPRHSLKTIAFMIFDHIGGVDTLLYSLSNQSSLIALESRDPIEICKSIEAHKAEVLPVSPTFLKLLILSEAYKEHDLSSLKYVSYGAEVMPESTLLKCSEIFPKAKLLQKYGTTEVGTLRSSSESNNTTWIKIGGEGYETRIVDDILQIKAHSAMLGYLNAPSPFTDDGWFITGDKVEVKGDYIRILGRKSAMINVGGEKIYPAEIENIILELSEVNDVTVYGEENAILGNIVCADIELNVELDRKSFTSLLKDRCKESLPGPKMPAKINIVESTEHTARFKKKKSE